jgi:hypothetical protein
MEQDEYHMPEDLDNLDDDSDTDDSEAADDE